MKRIIYTVVAAAAIITGGVAAAAPAFASTQASKSDVSAYFYNPSGQALGGPQAMGTIPGAHVAFGSSYLAKVTEPVNNMDLTGKTITITGHLDSGTLVADQPNGGDSSTPPGAPNMRVFFQGSSGGVSGQSPQGYLGQPWWSHSAVVYLNSQTGEFTVTAQVGATSDWSDWNGKSADQNADLFTGAASHVRELGLSFGGGYFFENGVAGAGGLTIDSIQVG
jgi:hypothetical protein